MEKINLDEVILFLLDVLYFNFAKSNICFLEFRQFRIQELIKFTCEVGYFMVQKLYVIKSCVVIDQFS